MLFLPPEDIPNPGIEPESSVSPTAQADSLPTEPSGKPIDTHNAMLYTYYKSNYLNFRSDINFRKNVYLDRDDDINPKKCNLNMSVKYVKPIYFIITFIKSIHWNHSVYSHYH